MAVPVIDLSGETRLVVDRVGRACREIGFLTVTGHTLPDELIEGTAEAARGFFDLSADEKLAFTQGEPALGLPVYRPLRSERALFEAYFEALGGLGQRIRRLFALALDLPEDWFEPSFRGHSSSLRVINYPRARSSPASSARGAHTDYGCMTILRTEDAPGGLQVQTRAGEWLDVHAVPGSFVVNLGDMMARWTNDRWLATLHRAVPRPTGRPAAAARRSSSSTTRAQTR